MYQILAWLKHHQITNPLPNFTVALWPVGLPGFLSNKMLDDQVLDKAWLFFTSHG